MTLANGDSHGLEWDGRFWYQYESGCAESYVMPELYRLLARVCYTKAGDREPTCTTPRLLQSSSSITDTFVAQD